MATEITLPKLSDTMDEGKVLRWLKRVGDEVALGDVVAEVETDKADMEVEASVAGVISEIRVAEGDTVAVGAVLAVLGGEAKAGSRGAPTGPGGKAGGARASEPPAADLAAVPAASKPRPAAASSPPRAEPVPPALPQDVAVSPPAQAKVRVSPLAQRLARERGVDLAAVKGSGAEGKIVARDVEVPTAPLRGAKPGPVVTPGRLELSKMRQSIARRMAEAKNGVPHFYVTAEIDMGEAARLLEALKQQVDAQVTVSHVVVKAAAMALLEHPRVNGQWLEGAVQIPDTVNIGLAVAVDDGLIVPVIHSCETLSLPELAAEARRLVTAARQGGFSGDDLRGGTFSVSNLGILDVDEFSAIINAPQAAILAVGSIKDRPVVRQGQLAVGRTMRVTLSCDHRQLNGMEGARFLETFRLILENPLRMIL